MLAAGAALAPPWHFLPPVDVAPPPPSLPAAPGHARRPLPNPQINLAASKRYLAAPNIRVPWPGIPD
ncbi:hypothetical protein MNEG_16709, partial [Monoraphidium neglectum]